MDDVASTPDERIGLIDLEKSVFPGDPMTDITKLLLFKHDYIAPDPKYSYVPPQLDVDSKKSLLVRVSLPSAQ